MVIVRQLTTKLSFQVDKKGIENFQRSIVGIKTRLAIATTAVSGFIAGFIKTTSAISNTILEMDLLSRSTDTSLEKLIAFQRVASRVGIDKSQFLSTFNFLDRRIKDAEQGIGTLREDTKRAGIDILDPSGRALPTIDILSQIISKIQQVQKESDRFIISEQLLGNKLFADIALDAIPKAEQESKELAKTFRENTENAKRFREEMSKLNDVFTEFIFLLSPLVTFMSKAVGDINQQIKNIKEGKFLDESAKSIAEDADAFFDIFKNFFNRFDRGEALINDPDSAIRRILSINTKIEMTVPEGTSEQQQAFLNDSAKQAYNEVFVNQMQKIGNDFPITG